MPPARLGHLNCLDWIMEGETPRHAEEVWVIDMYSRKTRRIGAGAGPHWSRNHDRLYYCDPTDNTLYAISVEDRSSPPTPVLSHCGSPRPRISPDGRYVAESINRELRIVDLTTKDVVATWTLPPVSRDIPLVQWSPDSEELSIGSFLGSEMGLWIYRLNTRSAAKLVSGPVATACWSGDRQRLAICLGPPFVEIWLADLMPERPTAESLNPVQTPEEHLAWLVAKLNREIEVDPTLIYAYDQRADCALWAGHEKASEFLREFDRVLTSYNAPACASRARRILDWPPDQRNRLLPVAQMLARKAAAKEPENAEYRDLLERASQHEP